MIRTTDPETGETTDWKEEDFYKHRDKLLVDWQAEQKILEAAKEKEMKLRKEIIALCFDPAKQAGTEYHELGNGWKLKGGKSITYGWVKDQHDELNRDAIYVALNTIAGLSPESKLVAERLVKWQADLSLSQYKLLNAAEKTVIDTVIVTKPGAPKLEIIPPKQPKTKPVWNGTT